MMSSIGVRPLPDPWVDHGRHTPIWEPIHRYEEGPVRPAARTMFLPGKATPSSVAPWLSPDWSISSTTTMQY